MQQIEVDKHENIFYRPDYFRSFLKDSSLVICDPSKYNGKSFMCVFFTRFCSIGCPFCFFKSAPASGEMDIADQFTPQGIDKFIEFCNKANLGYVLISGGGEPMTQKEAVLRTIAEVATNRIVLVTSGSWATNGDSARKYLQAIETALGSRGEPCLVTIRISVSAGHAIKLGTRCAENLIRLFESDYRDHPYLRFQMHGFERDPIFGKVLEGFPGCSAQYLSQARRESDDETVLKVIPQKVMVTLASGYKFIGGISKIFGSGLRPDLTRPEHLGEAIRIFERDLEESEDNNSAVIFNSDGTLGLDWSLNYNGNMCLWQNQVNDNQKNIYEDDFEDIWETNFSDPLLLSYLEKGCKYRENIVAEVSPRSVLRYKAIGLRDYSGTVLFEEEKVRLYYSIRVLQDYLQEGRLDSIQLGQLPEVLRNFIQIAPQKLKALYKSAEYTIVDQYKRMPFDEVKWRDLLELVKLGHYDLSLKQIQDALCYFNSRAINKYASITEVKTEIGLDIQQRLIERLMFMKPSAKSLSPSRTRPQQPKKLAVP